MSSQHYNALARAVRDRRRELDLTQLQVAERGGPPDTKISQIKAGKPQAISPATLRKLDGGLNRWKGNSRWILGHGEHPTDADLARGAAQGADLVDDETIERVLARTTPERVAAELLRRTGQVAPTQQARRDADAAGEDSQDPGEGEPA